MVIEIRKPIDGIKMVVYLMAESFLSPQSITGVFPYLTHSHLVYILIKGSHALHYSCVEMTEVIHIKICKFERKKAFRKINK